MFGKLLAKTRTGSETHHEATLNQVQISQLPSLKGLRGEAQRKLNTLNPRYYTVFHGELIMTNAMKKHKVPRALTS